MVINKYEVGVNSGARNVGRFFLALIPWAIAVGISVWLGVWIGYHNFAHQLSQENRAAVYTGAAERPKSKILVDIVSKNCSHVTRADIDGTVLMLYATHQNCGEKVNYFSWHWQGISPSGVIVHEGYENQCPIPGPQEIAECRLEVSDDDRISKLRVWTQIRP